VKGGVGGPTGGGEEGYMPTWWHAGFEFSPGSDEKNSVHTRSEENFKHVGRA